MTRRLPDTYIFIIFTLSFMLPWITADAGGEEISITRGRALTVTENLLECAGARISGVGIITGSDQRSWTVPAETNYINGPRAPDLYNDCDGHTPSGINEIDITAIPIVEVDRDGEVITGYIFSDNYFELYVNGKLIAVDAVPFTPFNSSIVRFRARTPVTYAVRLVDWEENLGLGTELNHGNPYHAGDGGFAAQFSDGTVTDSSWKAQVFYIAPLDEPDNLVLQADGVRSSTQVDLENLHCGEDCYGVHYPLPDGWEKPGFNDSSWPDAYEFANETVVVFNKPAYMNFEHLFIGSGARFIWTSNLVLDNLVLVRKTGPAQRTSKLSSSGGRN